MIDKSIQVKDLKSSNQPIWFTQNKYKKYNPINKKGWIAVLLPLVFFFINIAVGAILIDISANTGIEYIVKYLVPVSIFVNAIFTIYAINLATSLTSSTYEK